MRLLNVVWSVLPDTDRRYFSRNVEGLPMTASSRKKCHTDLNRIDDTRGSITVEAGDLAVNERNFDRQAHSLHTRGTFWILKNVNIFTRDIWEENYFWGKLFPNVCQNALYMSRGRFWAKKISKKIIISKKNQILSNNFLAGFSKLHSTCSEEHLGLKKMSTVIMFTLN